MGKYIQRMKEAQAYQTLWRENPGRAEVSLKVNLIPDADLFNPRSKITAIYEVTDVGADTAGKCLSAWRWSGFDIGYSGNWRWKGLDKGPKCKSGKNIAVDQVGSLRETLANANWEFTVMLTPSAELNDPTIKDKHVFMCSPGSFTATRRGIDVPTEADREHLWKNERDNLLWKPMIPESVVYIEPGSYRVVVLFDRFIFREHRDSLGKSILKSISPLFGTKETTYDARMVLYDTRSFDLDIKAGTRHVFSYASTIDGLTYEASAIR